MRDGCGSAALGNGSMDGDHDLTLGSRDARYPEASNRVQLITLRSSWRGNYPGPEPTPQHGQAGRIGCLASP